MRSKLPRIAAIGVTILLLLTGILLLSPRRELPRPSFLGDREPVASGVLPGFRTRKPGMHGTSEYEVYSWPELHTAFLRRAEPELRSKGFKQGPNRPQGGSRANLVEWPCLDGTTILTEAGESRAFPTVRPDPGWTTVTVCRRAPETLLTRLRVWLR